MIIRRDRRSSSANPVTLTAGPIFGGTQNLTFTNTSAISTSLAKTVTLTSASGTTLAFAAALNNSNDANSTLTVNGPTLQNASANALSLSGLAISPSATSRTATINGSANVTITGPVTNGGSATASGLTYSGIGTLTLNSATPNTYAGTTTLASSAGTVVLDFANMATPTNLVVNTSPLTMTGGRLVVKGKSTGAAQTQQTLGNLTLSANSGDAITVDSNGNANGAKLTLGTFTRNNGSTLNIDLSAGNTSLATTIAAGTLGYATVKDATGIGFAQATGTGIVRLTGQTALANNSNAATTDFITGPTGTSTTGSPYLTMAGSFSANTLSIDTSGATGDNVLDLGGATDVMTLTANGLLMTGSGNMTIQNGEIGAVATDTIIHNMGTGTLTINGTITGTSGRFTKDGPGTVTLGAANTFTNGVALDGGTLNVNAVGALGTGTTTVTGGTLKVNVASATGTAASSAVTIIGGHVVPTVSNAFQGTTTFSNFNMNAATAGASAPVFDLNGTTQNIGTLASNSTTDLGGVITSTGGAASLIINEGTTSGNVFGGTRFLDGPGSPLAITLKQNVNGTNSNNIQITNPNSNYSGGLTLSSSTTSSLTTANLATAGGLTGQTSAGMRTNVNGAMGTSGITLDNGQLFLITPAVAPWNVPNPITVTARGGVFHMEATGIFAGAIHDPSSGLIVVNSNSGNNNIIGFSGSMADIGANTTLALDTSNIGGINLSGSALGNSNLNLLWYGNGSNGGTGRVRWNGTGSTTLTFGELNNFSSGAAGSTQSGIIENAVASTTATYSIGDSNSTSATFQGVIRNGTGIVALTKTGTNTQNLSGGEYLYREYHSKWWDIECHRVVGC